MARLRDAVVGGLTEAEHLGVPGVVGGVVRGRAHLAAVPALPTVPAVSGVVAAVAGVAEVLRLTVLPAALAPQGVPGPAGLYGRLPRLRGRRVRRLPGCAGSLLRGKVPLLSCVPGIPAVSHPESSHALERTVSGRTGCRGPGGGPRIAAEL
ncbi:hypothetical protein GCM10023079_17240 [Streptomyces chitinivorans]